MFHPRVGYWLISVVVLANSLRRRMPNFCRSQLKTCRSKKISRTSIAWLIKICRLMFWSVNEELYNVDQLTRDAQATIDLAMRRNMSPEDIQLVQEAFRHM